MRRMMRRDRMMTMMMKMAMTMRSRWFQQASCSKEVPKPYTDWSKLQVKRITKKGLEVAELKPDGSTGFMVASFPNDPAISTRTEIPITM